MHYNRSAMRLFFIPAAAVSRSVKPGLAAALLLAAAPVFAAAPAPASGIAAVRAAFVRAYASAQLGGNAWRERAAGLENYPLYPYLEATALEHDLATATPTEVEAYLERYPGLIPAQDLRRDFLRELASRKDWHDFLVIYRPGLGNTLACDALRARLAGGGELDFEHDLSALWAEPSLPGACDPVLQWAQEHGLLTRERLFARIDAAAQAGYGGTVASLARWLPAADARVVRRLALALRDPAEAVHVAANWPDDPRDREAAMYAITGFAREDSARALAEWPALAEHFHFDSATTDHILAALALYRASDFGDDALALLTALPPAAQTDATREWRVRIALAHEDWPAALAALDALTPAQQDDLEWRYFRARALAATGHETEADALYAALARETDYFGFLAADRIGTPYAICPRTPDEETTDAQRLLANPGLERAFELFAVGMLRDARREWDAAFADADDETVDAAGFLAARRGWYSRPIVAFARTRSWKYYDERFPLAWQSDVSAAAKASGLDPAWVNGLIRAESAWMPDAGSDAGAQGLMQLMPSTARMVARQQQIPYDDDLYDPAVNIALGTRYLQDMALRYDDAAWLATAAYNAGPGRVDRWLAARGSLPPDLFVATIPWQETREYVARVLAYSVIYDWRLNGNAVAISRRMPPYGSFDPPPSATTPRKAVACPLPAATKSGAATKPP
ncbi:MAG TPA: transglycosylase SLT domain-containing protein [Gammaproteobacteria bacterium]|nr:transglycosylase SLT domain-containing protein [Gammaproteobacteria bacterium]